MASDTVTRKLWANAKKRHKCTIRKCPEEVKAKEELKPVFEKEIAKKCNKKPCLKYYSCAAAKIKPMNLTKKRTKGEFVKDFKEWQKELKKKCGSGKECKKSQKCSQKIFKESGFEKVLSDLIDCKFEKC